MAYDTGQYPQDAEGDGYEGAPPGPFDKKRRLRVGFGFYLASIIVVGLAVFILMLVQYYPGHRQSYRLEQAVKGADYVYVGIRIPKDELLKRNVNPLTMEIELKKMLMYMGAKSARAEINPDRTRIPYEK